MRATFNKIQFISQEIKMEINEAASLGLSEEGVELLQQVNEMDLSPSKKEILREYCFPNLLPGSHVAIKTKSLIPTQDHVWHHGIYVGNHQIIHMFGDTKEDACICLVSTEDFFKASIWEGWFAHVLYQSSSPKQVSIEFNLELSCRLAFLLKDTLGIEKGHYHIAYFNCEHFATFCRTGKWRYEHDVQMKQLSALTLQDDDLIKPSCKFAGQNKLKK
jgi:hypothetical protein